MAMNQVKLVKIFLTDHDKSVMRVPASTTFKDLLKQLEQKRSLDLPYPKYKFVLRQIPPTPVAAKDKDAAAKKKPADSTPKYVEVPVSMESTLFSIKESVPELYLTPSFDTAILSKVFGEALAKAASKNPKSLIPDVVHVSLSFINQYGCDSIGIWRLSGNMAHINEIKRKFDQGQTNPYTPTTDPNVVTGVIKLYLRELPDPLLTFERYDKFIQLSNKTISAKERIVELRELLNTLPESNYNTLQMLVALCSRVAEFSSTNKMNPENLALVIGPNILRAEGNNELQSLTLDNPAMGKIISLMIENYSQLFKKVSPFNPATKGLEDLPAEKIIGGNSQPEGDVIKGHIPRGVYEPSMESRKEKVFEGKEVRNSGESLICLEDGRVEREVPFDSIVEVDLSLDFVDQCSIFYKARNKKVYVFHVRDDNIQTWFDVLESSRQRYQQFIKYANERPEEYGIIISKERLMEIKAEKKTQSRLRRESEKLERKERIQRQSIFHRLHDAENPETGPPAEVGGSVLVSPRGQPVISPRGAESQQPPVTSPVVSPRPTQPQQESQPVQQPQQQPSTEPSPSLSPVVSPRPKVEAQPTQQAPVTETAPIAANNSENEAAYWKSKYLEQLNRAEYLERRVGELERLLAEMAT